MNGDVKLTSGALVVVVVVVVDDDVSGCCAAAAVAAVSAAGSTDKRAECRAKSDSSAKRISDLEARNEVDGPLSDVWDDACAVGSPVVVGVMSVDERWESWGIISQKLDG